MWNQCIGADLGSTGASGAAHDEFAALNDIANIFSNDQDSLIDSRLAVHTTSPEDAGGASCISSLDHPSASMPSRGMAAGGGSDDSGGGGGGGGGGAGVYAGANGQSEQSGGPGPAFPATKLVGLGVACGVTLGPAVSGTKQEGMEAVVVVAGGCGQNFMRHTSVEYYNPNTKQWNQLAPMNSSRGFCTMTTFNGHLYVCGGHDGFAPLNSVERYNADTNTWSETAPMNRARTGSTAFVRQNKLYVVGGEDEYSPSGLEDTIEMYNPSKDRWTLLPVIFPARRMFSSVFVMDKVYLLGGMPKSNQRQPTRVCDALDLKTLEISTVVCLPQTRCVFHTVAHNNTLICVGGHDGKAALSTIDILDIGTGKWSQNPACSRLEFGRPMCMATVADDTVYIVGGVDHRSGKRATGECIKLKPSWGPSTPIPAMIHERASCGITTMYYNPARITLPTASCEERVQIDKASAAASAKERAERAVDEHNGVMKEHVCMRNPKCKKQNKHTGRCKIREDDDAAPTSAPNKRAKALPAVGSFPAKQGAAAGKGTGHTA